MPFFDENQAVAALEALGFTPDPADTEKRGVPFQIGALLALAEAAAWQDIDRMDLVELHSGYVTMLINLTGSDPQDVARAWAVMINGRLNRTAIEVNEATEGDARMFVDVAGPAMLAASNLMAVLNDSEVPREKMRATIAQADDNLKKARKSLAETKVKLRKMGIAID